jgi:hypothetical protein
MQKNAEILKNMNAALAAAYTAKTGKSQDEILKLMDKETWLTANQALEMGFVNSIAKDSAVFTNNVSGLRLTDEIRQKVLAEREQKNQIENEKSNLLRDIDLYGV